MCIKRIRRIVFLFLLTAPFLSLSQHQSTGNLDSLKREIINLQVDVQNIKLSFKINRKRVFSAFYTH